MSAQARLALLLLAVFMLDAALVISGLTRDFDLRVLTALRQADLPGVAISPAWTVRIAIGVTMLGGGIVRAPLTIASAIGLAVARRRRDAALLAGAVASGALALFLLKLLFHRPRPDLVWHLVAEHDASFPSGHAMGSMILYSLLGMLVGRLAGVATARAGLAIGIAIALAVGLTRIFLGVHWTSDVIGGWAIGGAWALAAVAVIRRQG